MRSYKNLDLVVFCGCRRSFSRPELKSVRISDIVSGGYFRIGHRLPVPPRRSGSQVNGVGRRWERARGADRGGQGGRAESGGENRFHVFINVSYYRINRQQSGMRGRAGGSVLICLISLSNRFSSLSEVVIRTQNYEKGKKWTERNRRW